MVKKHRNNKLIPSNSPIRPIIHTHYSRHVGYYLLAGFVSICFFSFGIGLLFEKQYILAIIPFSLVGAIIYAVFTEVQELRVYKDQMFVKYLTHTQTYKVEEIESVERKMLKVIDRHTTIKLSPYLFIYTKDGKHTSVPLEERPDLENNILNWLKKYPMYINAYLFNSE